MLQIMLQANLGQLAQGSISQYMGYAPYAILAGVIVGFILVIRARRQAANYQRAEMEYNRQRFGLTRNQQQTNQQASQQASSQSNAQADFSSARPSGTNSDGIISFWAIRQISGLAKKNRISETEMLDEIILAYLSKGRPQMPKQGSQQSGGRGQGQGGFRATMDKNLDDFLNGGGMFGGGGV
jgi:hypothetical protein